MTAGFSAAPFPNPSVYPPAPGRRLTMADIQARLGTRVLNTSRIALDLQYLAGLQENQPALRPVSVFPETGWHRVDAFLRKMGQTGSYAYYGGRDVLVESARGALAGSLGGGVLGLLAGGLTHLIHKNWLPKYCLPIGAFVGGSLGLLSGSTIAFVKTTHKLSKRLKETMDQRYQAVKASVWHDLK